MRGLEQRSQGEAGREGGEGDCYGISSPHTLTTVFIVKC